ncbi:MAG TPA: hypothetical protein DD490_02290 [Acidobacteria bacterium]|nr:hypothetical protein [Acidobacteriota bacterium]
MTLEAPPVEPEPPIDGAPAEEPPVPAEPWPDEPVPDSAAGVAEPPPVDPMDVPVDALDLPAEAPAAIPPPQAPPSAPAAPGTGRPAKAPGETFRVRLAEAGKGFRAGIVGQLRVSAVGLAFTRDGQSRADWSIAWKDLEAARKEKGLWDAPFVLGLIGRDGSRRFLARLDKSGRYLDGAPLLAAIVRTGGARLK